jgi:glutathione synthase
MAPLSAHLIAAGVRLAGVDLIGNHVIEVNALNPGGAFHADRLHHSDVAGGIIERLAAGRADGPQGRTSCPANP